jgi:hypothetical protein
MYALTRRLKEDTTHASVCLDQKIERGYHLLVIRRLSHYPTQMYALIRRLKEDTTHFIILFNANVGV